jgi:hypothetical protein
VGRYNLETIRATVNEGFDVRGSYIGLRERRTLIPAKLDSVNQKRDPDRSPVQVQLLGCR